uniref:Uncharacterized protein n=1 Tax=Panagrolaimus sp. PS1159 TaxID=55785 RepID=A0AC35FQD0_9BILA
MDMFDKDICDFVGKYSSELDIGQNYLSLQNESDEQNINQNDEEFVLSKLEIQENTEGFHGNGHDMTYSDPNEMIVVQHEEINKGISNKLAIPSNTNHIFKSASLPATPITVSAKKQRKSYRNCCRAMKTWLINKPETFLPTAEAEFSKYSAEVIESLKMKPSKVGRPRLKIGKLS